MAKLSGNRKIGELPQERRMRQQLDEIIKEEIADMEHIHNYESSENQVEFPKKGRKKKDNL